jgi:hypothetical protein
MRNCGVRNTGGYEQRNSDGGVGTSRKGLQLHGVISVCRQGFTKLISSSATTPAVLPPPFARPNDDLRQPFYESAVVTEHGL